MSAAPRIRSCDIDAALEAERKFGRPVRAITRDGVTIHFDDPAAKAANDTHDPLTAWEIKRGHREAEGR